MSNLLSETRIKLQEVWSEVGLSEDERERQMAALELDLHLVAARKIEEEIALRDEYKAESDRLEHDVRTIAERVGVVPDIDSGVPQTLSDRLALLRRTFEEVDAKLSVLTREYDACLQIISSGCAQLNESIPPNVCEIPHVLVGDTKLPLFKKSAKLIEAKVKTRSDEMTLDVLQCASLLKELKPDYVDGDVEMSRFTKESDVVDVFGTLSSECALRVTERLIELESLRESRIKTVRDLKSRIRPLRDLLGVSREDDPDEIDELDAETILNLEHELDSLEQLKIEKQEELLSDARIALAELYVSALVPAREQLVDYASCGDLDVLQSETQKMRSRMAKVTPLTARSARYLELATERIDYLERLKDSSRLLSRKGGRALREEELQRKRIEGELPKLIAHLRKVIPLFEKEFSCRFVLKDRTDVDSTVSFLEQLNERENAHVDAIKEERLEKQRLKKLEMDNLRNARITGHPVGSASKPFKAKRAPLSSRKVNHKA